MADEQEVQDVPLPGPPAPSGPQLDVFCFACGKFIRNEPAPADHARTGKQLWKSDRCAECSAA